MLNTCMLANTVLLLELLILSWVSEKHLQVVLEEDWLSSVDIGSPNPQGDIAPDGFQWAEEAYPQGHNVKSCLCQQSAQELGWGT